ncbi:Diphthine synthase [Gonapodya prolifera JEL478]|uniref:diphthine methyl ester synthase n=1 Tax=Gonapodya prolifera (strain JEL478) TaxID=1344416 RepID=A0A139AY63_GONPJ|nr:Diphthine synthase [Gonapodya prolifera JEL478]|eukprot:KXS21513.1 Diphthine synthase [Gonapodya prolifera JEL478]
MLYLVGLGLADEKDITVKGLEAVRSSERVYLEAYTSLLLVGVEKLEDFYGKKITIADREAVESAADAILKDADHVNVSFLVVGDPYGATTHTDLVIRAKERGIPVQSIHNASILNAVGVCGLQLYNYGMAVSIPFFTETWRPDSFYEKIQTNRLNGLHTLCLLDIKVKEPTLESLARGRKIYEPPRFMTVNQAINQLLEVENGRGGKVYSDKTIGVGLARVGSLDAKIVVGTLGELSEVDFGAPLHSLIVPGKMHPLEVELVETFAINSTKFRENVQMV